MVNLVAQGLLERLDVFETNEICSSDKLCFFIFFFIGKKRPKMAFLQMARFQTNSGVFECLSWRRMWLAPLCGVKLGGKKNNIFLIIVFRLLEVLFSIRLVFFMICSRSRCSMLCSDHHRPNCFESGSLVFICLGTSCFSLTELQVQLTTASAVVR